MLRQHFGDDLVWGSLDLREGQAGTRNDDDGPWAEDPVPHVFARRVFNACDAVWTAIGYDEESGRVAIGRRDGCITFLRL